MDGIYAIIHPKNVILISKLMSLISFELLLLNKDSKRETKVF